MLSNHQDHSVDSAGDRLRRQIRAEGIGIAPDVLPHIFGLFEQGSVQSLDRAEGGLGIGVALVKRLVEMHGGTVAAASEGLGKGACFTMWLPYAAAGGSSAT